MSLLPLLLIGLPLLLSAWAHGFTRQGASSLMLWVLVALPYGLSQLLNRQHAKLALLIILGGAAVTAIGQILFILIDTGVWTRPTAANLLAPVMVAAIILSLKEEKPGLAALYGAALLISGSRAGLLSGFAAWAVSHWFVGGKLPRWMPAAILGAGLITMTVFDATHGSLSQRIDWWAFAFTIWDSNFWVGAGPGSLRAMNLPYMPHAHNIWMQAVADLGLAGLIAVIGVVGFYAWRVWQSDDRRWPTMLIAALLMDGVFDFIYWAPPVTVSLLLIGDQLLPQTLRKHQEPYEHNQQPDHDTPRLRVMP